MRRILPIFIIIILSSMGFAVNAQEESSGDLLDSLLGEAPINERLFYRVPLARDYEATIYGNRLQGVGHLELTIVSLEGDALTAANDVALIISYADDIETDQAISRGYTSTYKDGAFIVDDINWQWEGAYNLEIIIDGEPYQLEIYVPPAKPDASSTFIGANIAIPVIFLIVILGLYRLFKVEFLPENRRKVAHA